MKIIAHFILFVAFIKIGLMTMSGKMQNYISFDNVLSEIAFGLISFLIAGIFMITAFDRKKTEE